MKDLIRKQLEMTRQVQVKKLMLAEFLQHLILQSLYRLGAFKNLVFTGGTALRILHHTDRYSEDLDFSLIRAKGFEFRSLFERVGQDLRMQQLGFELYPIKNQKTVAQADLRFPALLKEFGISPLRDQKLTLKIEIDKHPPQGGTTEMALVTSPVSYMVTTFDLASLFATKLHAIFFRGYTKGRDYYDLVWFLGKGIKPNFKLLNHAIRQTEGNGHDVNEINFKETLTSHLQTVDFSKIRAEVERFLIDRELLEFLNFKAIQSLLRSYG